MILASFGKYNNNLIRAASCIVILLLMAGVATNPNPKASLNLRGGYLVVHIGTDVLKKIFDDKVGDFVRYLKSNPKYMKTLKELIHCGIINKDQESKLPPSNRNPTSSDFDITLLVCLLRNVCGFKPHNDPEWDNTSGNSVESYIAQFRICRNRLFHGEMYTSDAAALWTEISRILHGLNTTAGIPNLQKQIDEAAETPIDENLMQLHTEALRLWMKMDTSFDRENKSMIGKFMLYEQEINKSTDESVAVLMKCSEYCDHKEQLQKIKAGCYENVAKEIKPRKHEISKEYDRYHSGTDTAKCACNNLTDNIRCQYLSLIVVGREMFRALFKGITNNDFWNYLQKNIELKNRLTVLVNTNKMSDTLKPFLSQETITTATENLDLGTLYCLLRFVCGLSEPDDTVWIEPSEQDVSVAANIARFRQCANKFLLCNTELLTQEDIDEFIGILWRLNGDGIIPDLDSKIENAKQRTPNEESNESYFEHANVWCNMDRLFHNGTGELVIASQNCFSAMKRELECSKVLRMKKINYVACSYNEHQRKDSLQSHQTDQYSQLDIERVIKNPLLMQYKDAKIQTFPDEYADMFDAYVWPAINTVECGKTQYITSYQHFLTMDNKSKRDIRITGEAASGKTCFFRFLSLSWSMAQSGEKCNGGVENDITFLATFDYVFHVSPPVADNTISVIDCIIQQYFYTDNMEKFRLLYVSLQHIIDTKKCLIILDGFDDKHETSSVQKIKSENCMYIATCTSVQLQTEDAEHMVQITGLHGDSLRRYINYLVNKLNMKPDEFWKEVDKYGIHDKLCIPKNASRLVLLWSMGGYKDKSKEQILDVIMNA